MERLLTAISWFIVPIAIPAWLLEGAYRRITKRFWQFNVWTGTLYILFLVALALMLVLGASTYLRAIGLYILTALEVLCLFLCASVPLGNLGGYVTIVKRLARRRVEPGGEVAKLGMSAIWIAITSYVFTAFYFGVVCYLLYGVNSSLYVGIQGQSKLGVLFDFIYFSYISITAFGFTAMSPTGILSKLLYMLQVTLGLIFVLFIFSLLADHLSERRSQIS